MSKADEIWTTKDGKKIKVKDMTTKKSLKKCEEGKEWIINILK